MSGGAPHPDLTVIFKLKLSWLFKLKINRLKKYKKDIKIKIEKFKIIFSLILKNQIPLTNF